MKNKCPRGESAVEGDREKRIERALRGEEWNRCVLHKHAHTYTLTGTHVHSLRQECMIWYQFKPQRKFHAGATCICVLVFVN